MKPARLRLAIVSEPATSLKSPARITVVSAPASATAHCGDLTRLHRADGHSVEAFRPVCQMRYTDVDPGAVLHPKAPAHRDPVVRQAVAMPGDLGCHLDLRAILERLDWSVSLKPA